MNAKFFWVSVVGIIVAFFGGFYVANTINSREFSRLLAENEQLKKTGPANQPNNETSLTDEEIKSRIAEADKNPADAAFQKNLGMALLSYGVMKQQSEIIGESARLLKRAFDANPKDFDVVVALGNAHYDIASLKQDDASFMEARQYYAKALEIKPDDAGVRADYGSTFVYVNPPDFDRANAELTKALTQEPKNQRALLLMTQSMLKQNKSADAEKFLARLREVNPKAPTLAELIAEMERDRNASAK